MFCASGVIESDASDDGETEFLGVMLDLIDRTSPRILTSIHR